MKISVRNNLPSAVRMTSPCQSLNTSEKLGQHFPTAMKLSGATVAFLVFFALFTSAWTYVLAYFLRIFLQMHADSCAQDERLSSQQPVIQVDWKKCLRLRFIYAFQIIHSRCLNPTNNLLKVGGTYWWFRSDQLCSYSPSTTV